MEPMREQTKNYYHVNSQIYESMHVWKPKTHHSLITILMLVENIAVDNLHMVSCTIAIQYRMIECPNKRHRFHHHFGARLVHTTTK